MNICLHIWYTYLYILVYTGQIMTTGQAILTRLSGFEPVIKVDAAKNTFVVSDGCNLIRNSSM